MSQALQCPQCNGAVSVPDQAGGKRVKCPHCNKAFLAPGPTAVTHGDDDDWLTLDSDPIPSRPPVLAPPLEDLRLDDPLGDDAPTDAPRADAPAAEQPPAKGPSAEDASNDSPISNDPLGDQTLVDEPLDDLALDDLMLAPLGAGATSKPSGDSASSSSPKFGADDEAALAEFSNDLDDFATEMESLPPVADFPLSGNLDQLPDVRQKPGGAATSGGAGFPGSEGRSPASSTPKTAQPVEYATEYRVNCLVCGSMHYAKATQVGKTIKCSDCYSPITIPEPPKIHKKPKVNLENAEVFGLEQAPSGTSRADPFTKSAQQMLDAASREGDEETVDSNYEVPSVKTWAVNVFGIFLDLGVLAHWLGLSVFAAIPTYLALKMDTPMLVMSLFPGGFFLGAIVVSCGIAILQSVANQEDSVSEWPVFDVFGWLGQLFLVVSAAMMAAVPVWALSQFLFGPTLVAVATTMFAVYALFPFILLSMLDMQSAFIPFSAEVARSVTKCEESWGGFYFSSGLLFGGLFLFFIMASMMSAPTAGVVIIFSGVAITFAYFAMIGRLAYAIGQAVNAPPMKNDIDRSQPTRTRDGSQQ